MSKFNTSTARAVGSGPIHTEGSASGRTREGGAGFGRDAKSELFLLAVANMVGEDTFYEKADQRDSRYVTLVRQLAVTDFDWLTRFARWLRSEANMRSASLVLAAEAAKARVDAGETGSRTIVSAVMQRADEPGELISYWISNYGKRIPQPVKRGVSDACGRLYNERSFLKWDSQSRGVRFADVIQLAHADPTAEWQSALFKYVIEARLGIEGLQIPAQLETLRANAELRKRTQEEVHALAVGGWLADMLSLAGMTWEDIPSLVNGPWTRQLWESIIPSMGYMACLAEGTPVWLPDGTTLPIEEVVSRRLDVLAPDREFDTALVKYGPSQPIRDCGMGEVIAATPTEWITQGRRTVVPIHLASGRVIDATPDHRWVKRRRGDRRESWEWVTTETLAVGDMLPVPVGINAWGNQSDAEEGYFVGAMLGDGCMTNHGTPEFAQIDDPTRDDMFEFMHSFAASWGCDFVKSGIRKWRFTFKPVRKMNPMKDMLVAHQVWGLKGVGKRFANRPYSREFWIGALSGLIDTDGHVRLRRNPKGTIHASIEYASISEALAKQYTDALLRLGIQSVMTRRASATNDVFLVSVNKAAAVKRAASVLRLLHETKRNRLAEAARVLPETPMENVEHDRITGFGEPYETNVYCVSVESYAFIANGVVTGNCLRNLRNLDQAEVSDGVAAVVAARLADPEQVAKSRQFPFRFYAAYKNTGSLRWGHALETALRHSLSNVPALKGRTLILVDQSPSMFPGPQYSGDASKSDIALAEKAALFGTAMALRVENADLFGYGFGSYPVRFGKGDAVLKTMQKFHVDSGTDTFGALQRHYRDHDRVLIVTDEQTAVNRQMLDPHVRRQYGLDVLRPVGSLVPAHVPVFTWNLCGYEYGHATGPNWHTFGGLTDTAFKMVPLIEQGRDADWPF